MDKSRSAIFLSTGFVLLLFVPMFVLMAGLIAYYLPRQYFSKATIEVRYHPADLSREFEVAELPYHGSVEIRPIRATDLFEIGVWNAKPQQAADEANSIAAALKLKLENDSPEWGPRPPLSPFPQTNVLLTPVVKIWENAEPALEPGRPKVLFILSLGAGVGLFFAFFGFLFLIIGFRSRGEPRFGFIVV